MLLWFVGGAVVIVWAVVRDPAIDYRLVVVGALLPDVVDGVTTRAGVAHTLLASAAVLTAVMLGTRGNRGRRRRLLAVPIGMIVHLVLDGVWGDPELFWWPALGGHLWADPLPSWDRPIVVVALLEAAGVAMLAWFVARFGLSDRTRRRRLASTGRLDRARAGG